MGLGSRHSLLWPSPTLCSHYMVKCKQESISKINGLTYKELWGFFFKIFSKTFFIPKKAKRRYCPNYM